MLMWFLKSASYTLTPVPISNKGPRLKRFPHVSEVYNDKSMLRWADIVQSHLPMLSLSKRRASAMTWHSFGSGPPPAGVKQVVVPEIGINF